MIGHNSFFPNIGSQVAANNFWRQSRIFAFSTGTIAVKKLNDP
jgi:hypothetical protein